MNPVYRVNCAIFKTALIGMFGSLARYIAFMDQHPSYEGQLWILADLANSKRDARYFAGEWFRYRVMPQLADDARTRRAQARILIQQKSFFDI